MPITMSARARSAGFTLIEILVVVVIIGILSVGVLLSINLTGRDTELERESDRLLSLVNYAREQAELQTREYGIVFHDDGYQFVVYDPRRGGGVWHPLFEDEVLRLRKLPQGLGFRLIVESRPVVLTPTGDAKQPKKPASDSKKSDSKTDLKSVVNQFANNLNAPTVHSSLDSSDDEDEELKAEKKIAPQVMIFSSGDLTSFEATVERDGGVRSVTLAQDDKGQVIERPLVENRT